jgi:hypothetical protein
MSKLAEGCEDGVVAVPVAVSAWPAGQRNGARTSMTICEGLGFVDAALTGPAASLLLVLMRRRPVSDPAVTVHGNSAVVDGWLANTAF